MRHPLRLVVLLWLCAAFGQAHLAAQPAPPPTIQRVTVRPDTGVLTISGTGLGPDLMVMVDGHPASVLPGASDTQLEVLAPDTVLSTPGTYRLTVVDAARQSGDGFIVAGPALPIVAGRQIAEVTGPRPTTIPTVRASADLESRRRDLRPSTEPQLTENSCGTAVGLNALANNLTKFCGNTAVGREAVNLTTTGISNTGVGAQALRNNTTGSFSTAIGFNAGLNATDGAHNVYLGADVVGEAADANTMRLGVPFDSGTGAGQTRAFIAGIHGTQLSDPAVQVFVDANGQLGTLTVPVATGTIDAPLGAPARAATEQDAVIAELRARVARLEALVQTLSRRR
jgi:hypothetical protein